MERTTRPTVRIMGALLCLLALVVLVAAALPGKAYADTRNDYNVNAVNGQVSLSNLGPWYEAVNTGPVYQAMTIYIKADDAPEGKVFDHWFISNGSIPVTDAEAASTSITVPVPAMIGANIPVTVTAYYKDPAKDITACTVSSIYPQAYTGSAITPSVKVADVGSKLEEGVDYVTSYQNNVNVGVATVTITGKGRYAGTTTATFEIKNPNVIVSETANGLVEPVLKGEGDYYIPSRYFNAGDDVFVIVGGEEGYEIGSFAVTCGDNPVSGVTIVYSKDGANIYGFTMPDDNVRIRATFKKKGISSPIEALVVRFDANGHGTAPSVQEVAKGGKAAKPADPIAEGYQFGGWYKEAACVNPWDFGVDTVTADTALYAKWTEVVPADPAEAFVSRLYRQILDREPDVDGLGAQVAALKVGMAPAELVCNFFASGEYSSKTEASGKVVDRAYLAMFGRSADEAGKAMWVSYLDAGMSVRAVVAGFSQSAEYKAYFASMGVDNSAIEVVEPRDKNAGVTSFVSRLYAQCLGRAADVDGLNAQAYALIAGTPCWQVAVNFFTGSEFVGLGIPDDQVVERCYQAMMGRGSDAEGKAFWLGQMQSGMSVEDLVKGFCQSDEFEAI